MTTRILNEDTLAQLIGNVSMKWSSIEGAIKALIYDLTVYLSPAFENQDDEEPFHILLVILENMEIRNAITNAKALAFSIRDLPDFYDRAEKVLNRIDNKHRNERNRIIHDQWALTGPFVRRLRRGTVVSRTPGSGEKVMRHRTITKYLGVSELVEFAEALDSEVRLINELGEELRLRLNEIRPREG